MQPGVTLARPNARDALNAGLIEELAEDDNVRVVVLTGEGDYFCAGADVGYVRDTARAREAGVMREVADEGDPDAVVQEKVAGLLAGVPEALAANKALLRRLRERRQR